MIRSGHALAIALLLCSLDAAALQIVDARDGETVFARISQKELTRIGFERGRIRQVDPRDAWRGHTDAQLKALEDSSRETGRRSGEVEVQSRELQERLDKLERLGLTPLPPPPLAVPPLRPEFGPDRPATTS